MKRIVSFLTLISILAAVTAAANRSPTLRRPAEARRRAKPPPRLSPSPNTSNPMWTTTFMSSQTTTATRTAYRLSISHIRGGTQSRLRNYSQQIVTPAFIDTTIRGKSIRDEDSGKIIELIYDTQVYDIALLFDWGKVGTFVDIMLKNSSTNLASEYAKIKDNITAAMEKTMDVILDNWISHPKGRGAHKAFAP